MKPMSAKPSVYRPELEAPEPDAWLEPQNMNQNRTVRHRTVRPLPENGTGEKWGTGRAGGPGANDVFDHIASAIGVSPKPRTPKTSSK